MGYADALRSDDWTAEDVADLIEGILDDGFTDAVKTWTPSYGAGGSMSWTPASIVGASYYELGKWRHGQVRLAPGLIGGSVSNYIYFTLPDTPSRNQQNFMGMIEHNGAWRTVIGKNYGNQVQMSMDPSTTNYTLSATAALQCDFSYEAA